ncbi:hypothetical protein CEXT_301571 [Caerostris extrusa]|uniref:Uncharacterized protein n=1 Tax=Caerostris extrusa TaxID=172846 RepID=A0AAV4Q379_CAEEX|nr:hypothetical protein CEXT_301571 [Caerostris extrusa]
MFYCVFDGPCDILILAIFIFIGSLLLSRLDQRRKEGKKKVLRKSSKVLPPPVTRGLKMLQKDFFVSKEVNCGNHSRARVTNENDLVWGARLREIYYRTSLREWVSCSITGALKMI